MAEKPAIHTDIASHDLHHIWVRGNDLTADLMGKRTFTEIVFLLIAKRFPDPSELRMLDTVLVTLMEHGMTLSAAAARTTYWVAPESLQGAVAAGLLGAGSVVLGSMEECGQILTRIDDAVSAGTSRESAIKAIVDEYQQRKRRLPGIGHAIHTEGDPRATRLYEVAKECGRHGKHLEAMTELVKVAEAAAGRKLPLNATGAIAAVLLEMGVPWQLHKGFALISRTAGLVAHIGEEITAPVTPAIRAILFEKH